MALNAKITKEDFESLPEVIQAEYKEKDGNYLLDVSGLPTVAEKDKLNRTLAAVRAEKKEAKEKLAAFKGVLGDDRDLDGLENDLLELEELRETGGKGKLSEEQIQKRVNVALKQHNRELESLTSKLSEKDSEIAGYKKKELSNRLTSELTKIASGKIDPKATKDVLNAGKLALKFDEDVNSFVDSDGNTIDEWFNNELPEHNWQIPSKGAGAKGSGAGSKSNKMTATEALASLAQK